MIVNKIGEYQNEILFFKEYSIDPNYDIYNIVNAIINNGYNINYINIKENSDVDCKQYPFDYSVEKFLDMYGELDKSEINHYNIRFISDEVKTLLYDPNTNIATLYPIDKNFELSDLIEKKIKNNL